jgi:hypothetical protein
MCVGAFRVIRLGKTGLRALDLDEPITRDKIVRFLRRRNIFASWTKGRPVLEGLNASAQRHFLEVLDIRNVAQVRELNTELRNLSKKNLTKPESKPGTTRSC